MRVAWLHNPLGVLEQTNINTLFVVLLGLNAVVGRSALVDIVCIGVGTNGDAKEM